VASTSQFLWVRHTRRVVPLPPGEEARVDVTACVVRPGVYDLTRLRVTAVVDGEVMAVIQPASQALLTVVQAA
jgi:hypothetical protein